ncbi:MAG: hypothetical protein KJ574_05365 [Nanoarchaeota archaeon]|nr:hypothetical protein [Nanoarchaeota archaeon]
MIRLRKQPRHLRMNITDKIFIGNNRFCAPHHFPHKLPIGEPIREEPCHLHKARWRMAHHIPFCRFLKCPHYGFMLKEHEKFKRKRSIK